MREYGSARDASGRREHARGRGRWERAGSGDGENERVTKGEHYIGIPTVGDIGILQEQLYSAERLDSTRLDSTRLEIVLPRSPSPALHRRTSRKDEYKPRFKL